MGQSAGLPGGRLAAPVQDKLPQCGAGHAPQQGPGDVNPPVGDCIATMSGPRVRAWLSEPPETGRARKTAAPTHSPMATPAWASPPGARSRTAAAMTTTIRMRVMTNSVKPAVHQAIPGPGWVEPRISGSPRGGKVTQFARGGGSAPGIGGA